MLIQTNNENILHFREGASHVIRVTWWLASYICVSHNQIGYISVLPSVVVPTIPVLLTPFSCSNFSFKMSTKFGCFCPINFNHKYFLNNGLQWISPKVIPQDWSMRRVWRFLEIFRLQLCLPGCHLGILIAVISVMWKLSSKLKSWSLDCGLSLSVCFKNLSNIINF